jgi:hypothetical protein
MCVCIFVSSTDMPLSRVFLFVYAPFLDQQGTKSGLLVGEPLSFVQEVRVFLSYPCYVLQYMLYIGLHKFRAPVRMGDKLLWRGA